MAMLISLYCIDNPDSLELRMKCRPDHVAYLVKHADIIVYAGPLLDDAASNPIGSLLIIEVPRREFADDFSLNDPYTQAGLFAEVSIRPICQVFPKT